MVSECHSVPRLIWGAGDLTRRAPDTHNLRVLPAEQDSNNPRNEYSFSKAAKYLADLENWVYDEQKMQDTWGQMAFPPNAIENIPVETATAEALSKMDATEAERVVVTPTGERLTTADIQRELSTHLPGKKAEPYDPQASRLVQDAQIAQVSGLFASCIPRRR